MESQPMLNLTGRTYGRPRPQSDEDLALSGPGTSGGELLRRYWQPVGLSEEATHHPKLVRILNEELILFRNGKGEAGLLYPRCAHRGTSLLYGKVEESGIRCCYHGWMFDPQGYCVDTPCETNDTVKNSVRQPWYPVVERFGMLFTYMGPADRQPPFPKFYVSENLQPDEKIVAILNTYGPNGLGPHPKLAAKWDYNWFQTFDNFMDPFHVCVTHFMMNGAQFTPTLGILPEVKFEYTDEGVRNIQFRKLGDGRVHRRIGELILPNMHSTGGVTDEDLTPAGLGWLVPETDTSFRHYILARSSPRFDHFRSQANVGMLTDEWGPAHGKPFFEWSLQDHQEWQTDYVAQKGQGDITFHSEERLTSIDAGLSMMRRMFKKQAALVRDGKDPLGTGPEVERFVKSRAGNALLDAETLAVIAGHDE